MDFEIKNGVLKKYTGNGGDVIIPDGVTDIGNDAFEECTNLVSVTIPDSVRYIGKFAFWKCSNSIAVTFRGITFSLGEVWYYDNLQIFMMVANRDFSMRIPNQFKYPIVCSIFCNHPDDEATVIYIKRVFTRIFQYLIDKNDITTAEKFIHSGKFLTEHNIDKLIDCAIEKGANEIYVMLINYKNEHFGFTDINKRLKL